MAHLSHLNHLPQIGFAAASAPSAALPVIITVTRSGNDAVWTFNRPLAGAVNAAAAAPLEVEVGGIAYEAPLSVAAGGGAGESSITLAYSDVITDGNLWRATAAGSISFAPHNLTIPQSGTI